MLVSKSYNIFIVAMPNIFLFKQIILPREIVIKMSAFQLKPQCVLLVMPTGLCCWQVESKQ